MCIIVQNFDITSHEYIMNNFCFLHNIFNENVFSDRLTVDGSNHGGGGSSGGVGSCGSCGSGSSGVSGISGGVDSCGSCGGGSSGVSGSSGGGIGCDEGDCGGIFNNSHVAA